MRLSLVTLLLIFISCHVSGQGITRHGLNSSSGSDFVNKNGKTVNIPSLSRYGQELFMATVTTSSVVSVTSTSAVSGGDISNAYSVPVSACGLCWNTSPNPTVSHFKTSEEIEAGAFTSQLTRLMPSTTYYLRAYVTTVSGTAYGEEVSFQTLPRTDPSECLIAWYPFNGNADEETGLGTDGVINGAVLAEDRFGNADSAYYFNGTNNSVTIPGYLPVNNTFTISFWAFSEKETGTANIISDGSINIGGRDFLLNFRINEIGVRADKGTPLNYEYSSPAELKNLNLLNRWVHVAWVMNSGKSTIYLDGFKIADITIAGTNEGSHDDHVTIGARHVWTNMDNFFQGKLDELRIYNCNLQPDEIYGIYSAEGPVLPSLGTIFLSDTTSTSISVESNILSDGGATITERGVCWSNSSGPTISDNHTTDGTGTGSFTSNVTGLLPGTTYYLRSYSTNSAGTVYGNEISFTTKYIIPTDGLAAHWPFNGNANDESGNNNNGSVTSSILTSDRFGNPDKAYSFDGNGDYILVPDNDILSLVSHNFSFSFWVYINPGPGTDVNMGFISKRRFDSMDAANWEYNHGYDGATGNTIRFWFSALNGRCATYSGTDAYASEKGQWIHCVATSDNVSLKIYKDGILMAEAPRSYICSQGNGTGPLVFGRGGGWNQIYYLNGMLDDIRIYNRALSISEIEALYHEGGW